MNKAVIEKKLNFFQFSAFIEEECDAAYLNACYQRHKKRSPKKLTKLQVKQRQRVKLYPELLFGRVIDDEYDLDDWYFNV